MMTIQPVSATEGVLSLSQPVLANDEMHFSAFGPGWGFCSYALPAALVVARLGAANLSEQQLNLAFQVNRLRITQVVIEAGTSETGERVRLKEI
jgi:hypothetical protein